jgi:superfamily II DNA/RNA helicase
VLEACLGDEHAGRTQGGGGQQAAAPSVDGEPAGARAQVDEKRVIVFVNSKRACDIVYKQLDTLGYRCTVLHSGKTQARAWPAPVRPLGR